MTIRSYQLQDETVSLGVPCHSLWAVIFDGNGHELSNNYSCKKDICSSH